ncbi:MAG: hypothetical protein EXS17_02570 [Phycisphaerales bacterium]|nr:hypothetical protein [Phycisphaerales bacterium]
MSRVHSIAVASSMLALVLGCAAPSHLQHSAAVIFSLLPARTGAIELAAADRMQPIDSHWEWQIVDASGCATSDAIVTTSVQPSQAHGAELCATDIGGDCEFLARTAGGDLTLCAVDSPHDRVRTFFTPPLALPVPSGATSEVVVSSAAMRVDWMDGRGERDAGRGERSVRTVGLARVKTPQGEFDTLVVESEFQAALRVAKVRRVVTTYIAPHLGCIALTWDERVTVMGVSISRDCATAVRVSRIGAVTPPRLP